MKKLILILVVALFAFGVSTTYGQLAPRPITCLSADAFHPLPGNPYVYTVDVPNPPGSKTYTWLVTQDQTFINAGALVATPEIIGGPILAAADSWYDVPSIDKPSISLTWQSFAYDPANPVFVVIFVRANVGCQAPNIKVYKIEPSNAFTLDIANQDAAHVTQAGYGTNIDRCISDIVSSVYDAAAPEGILNDFGLDYLYYEVVAANWSEAWNPTVHITGIDPLELVTVQWTKDGTYAGGFNPMAGPANGTGGVTAVYTSATNVTPNSGGFVGSAGESIFIRITVDHSDLVNPSWQGLSDELIALAIDGVTVPSSGTGVGDVHYEAGGGPPPVCPWVDGYVNDIANQTLKARPTINDATPPPADNFLPIKP
jgi:hypothetical protein